ncbi:MAG: FAD-dependent oxidoreductase [Dehalococcoidia bacterium]
MDIDRADVVVIGGGVIGLATAYFTLKEGKDVVLVDKGIPGWEASGRNGGWAAGHGLDIHDMKNAGFLREGIKIWQTLDEELGAPTEFVKGGSLSIGFTEEEAWYLDKILEVCPKVGIEVKKVDLREMQEIIPGLHDRTLLGLFFPESGQANPQLTCQAWVWGIKRLGGRVYQNTRVTGINVQRDRVTGVETTAGNIEGEQVVNAAGPWSNVVNGMVGLSLPTEIILVEMLCTEPAPPLTKATFLGNVLYCRQAAHGHLHFGGFQTPSIDVRKSVNKPTSSLTTGDIARRFVELVPTTANIRVLRTWAGIIEMVPDFTPILGKAGYPGGYYLNVGYGGMGFSWSPIAGKMMSELLAKGKTSLGIEVLSPSRFYHSSD